MLWKELVLFSFSHYSRYNETFTDQLFFFFSLLTKKWSLSRAHLTSPNKKLSPESQNIIDVELRCFKGTILIRVKCVLKKSAGMPPESDFWLRRSFPTPNKKLKKGGSVPVKEVKAVASYTLLALVSDWISLTHSTVQVLSVLTLIWCFDALNTVYWVVFRWGC